MAFARLEIGTVRSLPSLIDAGPSMREPSGAVMGLESAEASSLQDAVLASVMLSRAPVGDIGHGTIVAANPYNIGGVSPVCGVPL
jgi:hypothetical protein